ncbi:MAG: helix-turn-helix transcriptional regulator [Tissierellaceae bacterium]
MKSFGESLRQLRKDKRITQRELASKIDVDFSYISKIETGALEPPSEEIIIKMSKILEVDEETMIMLAKKIPTSYKEIIVEDELAGLFLREVPRMSAEDREKVRKAILGDD